MRSLFALVLTLFAAAAQAQPQAVAPGQAFRWQQLALRAPASDGWVLLGSSAQSVAFMRRSDELARSEVATVSVFTLPDGLDGDGFAAWVQKTVQAELPASRFRVVDAQLAPSDERGYACISHHSHSHDLKARGLPAGSEPPLLQQLALYCRHPDRAGAGFAAAFSTRGPGADDTLPERARAFIAAVLPEANTAR